LATATEIREELEAAKTLRDYEAVDVLWVALLKVANTYPGNDEYKRMTSLVRSLPEARLTAILNSAAVNALLDLEPPLETILADQHERLYPDNTADAIREVREKRNDAARPAMLAFGGILRRIRNKREHGFKSQKGPRDVQILKAARGSLGQFV
jgi:hypothetical protein